MKSRMSAQVPYPAYKCCDHPAPVGPISASASGVPFDRRSIRSRNADEPVHITQIVGAGGEYVFVINTETVIQLEADTHTVVSTQVVTAIHILNTVSHKVGLNRFQRILTNREGVTREVFQTLCITGKVVINRHFLVVMKF